MLPENHAFSNKHNVIDFPNLPPGELRHDGEYHCDCPYCGKEAKPGQVHFAINLETGACYCQVCGNGDHVSKIFGDALPSRPPVAARPSKQPKPFTLTGRDVDRYAAHPHKYKLWAAQGVAPEVVDRYQLGVKNTPHGPVLTVPIYRGGKLVGLRTRGPDGWKNETGSRKQLYKVDDLTPGAVVILVANNRDALNLQYAMPEMSGYKVVTVSLTTGEASRLGPFAQDIADSGPLMVIVAYDNDETGRVQSAKRVKELQAAGVEAIAWRWAGDTPDKYDVGDMLTDFNHHRGDMLNDFVHWLRQKLSAVVALDNRIYTAQNEEENDPPQPDFALDIESLSQTVGTLSEQYNDFVQSIDGCWFSEGLPAIVASAIKFDAPPSELYKSILPTDGSGPTLDKWVQHDPAKGLAVWFVAHEAVKAGLFAPDGYITRGMIQKASGQVGHALTDHTIREGLNWLVHYGVWEFIENSVKFGHYIEPSSYSIQNSQGFIKPRSNADLYKPRPIEAALQSLAKKLRYELPAPFEDWLSSEEVQALRKHDVADTITHSVHRVLVGFDSTLSALTDINDVLRSPVFTVPDGFTITNAKSLRVAYLRAYADTHIDNLDMLQISIHEKALMLGISSSSVTQYTEAAGLATESQFKVIHITGKDARERQARFNGIKNKSGVYVQTEETAPVYLTEKNAPAMAEKVINSLEPVTVTIQQPSRLYIADRDEIQAKKSKRAAIHHQRLQRVKSDPHRVPKVPVPKKPHQRPTPPPCEVVTTPRPDEYTPAYKKTMATVLLWRNPHLQDVAQHDGIIAALLNRYGLLKVKPIAALVRAG